MYASLENSGEVIRVWKLLKNAFTKTTNKSYLTMFQSCAMYILKQCYDEWQSNHLSYDFRLSNVVMRAYLRKNMYKEAQSILDNAIEKGYGNHHFTREMFIGCNLKQNELMDWMDSQKLVGSHAVRIDLLSKVRGICIAEKFFYSLPDPAKNHRTYGALLACYCSKRMKDKAIPLYARMKELGLASGSLVYNNLMSLHMKSGQPVEVKKLFDEMQSCNTLPDKCSYKILIESYALLNDMDSIERIVQEMERNDGALHWSIYCHLAAIYNSTELFEKARSCLLKAELVMNWHDSSPFPYLLSLYAGAGYLLEVKRVWRLLKARIQKARRPTNLEYLVVLQALKKLADIDGLIVFFEEWESDCVSYDLRLVNTVIGAYLEKHRVEEAGLLLKKAMEEEDQPVVCSFFLFIDYYLKKGEVDQARRWSHAASSVVKRGHSELESE